VHVGESRGLSHLAKPVLFSARMPTPSPASSQWWRLLAVALATAALFLPAIHNDFTNWDDPAYIVENQLLRDLSPSGLAAIGTTFVEGNYHPLTILSLAIDYRFWKLNPTGYHLTNVVLHVLGTIAVFWFILLLTESVELGVITALFLGIHPLHVESVAWISGRKDLLFGLFYSAACGSYVLWARKGRRLAWGAALLLFVLALLSKGMAVTLPLALLAIDFYLRRPMSTRTLLIEKAPFWILALGFGVLAVIAQQSKGAVQELTRFPFYERVLVACYALVSYVFRALIPIRLSAFYPYPLARHGFFPIAYYVAPLLVLLLAAGVVASLRRGRAIAFCALFFFINVALVLQLVPIGSAAMADRYTYVSYVGLGLALGYGYHAMRRAVRTEAMGAVATALLIGFFVGLAVVTRERVKIWRDDISLWTDVVAKNPDLPMAYAKRAWAYHEKGEEPRAMVDLQRALALDPKNGEALTTRGTLYYLSGDYPKALADLDQAVRERPRSASTINNRGTVLLGMGRYDQAIADFSAAIRLKSWFTEAYLNRALAHGVKREYLQALPDLDRAIRYQPNNPQAYVWRAAARLELGDPEGTIVDCDAAIKLAPRFGEAYLARSNAYEKLHRYDEALRDARLAREAGLRVSDALIERLRTRAGRPP
jgi:protein O-mannosyl-transferase